MNPIASTLLSASSAMQILDYVVNKIPGAKKRIEQALNAGYTVDQIANHYQKSFPQNASTKKSNQLSKQFGDKPLTEGQKTHAQQLRTKREDRLGKTLGKAALGIAGATAGAAGLRALSAAQGAQAAGGARLLGGPGGAAAQGMPLPGAGPQGPAMGGGGPQAAGGQGMQGTMGQIFQAYQKHLARGGKLSLKSFMQTAAKTVMGNAMGAMGGDQQQPQGQAPMQSDQEPIDVTAEAQWNPMGGTEPPVQPGQPMSSAQAPTQPMPMEAQEPEAPPLQESTQSISPEEAAATLESMKLVTKVDNLLQAGNDPEAIKAMINFQLSPGQKKWLADQKLDINQVLDGYLAKPPETSETLPKQPTEMPSKITESVEEAQPKPLAQGATVMLPNGVTGEVTGIEGNKVRITDSEGNKKVAPLDHALQPSESVMLYTPEQIDEVIEKIPEKDRSTAFYVYQPLGDGLVWVELTSNADDGYLYENVPDELSEKILSASTAPKTSGGNLFGVYKQEVADSRGSPFTELRANPDKYPFKKVKKGYDLLKMFKQEATALNKERERQKRKAEAEKKKAAKKKK